MKLGIAERFSPTDSWEDGDDTRLFNYMSGLTAPSEEKEEDEEPKTRREGRGRIQRLNQQGYSLVELIITLSGMVGVGLLVVACVVACHFLAK
jgi:hypothetical protein